MNDVQERLTEIRNSDEVQNWNRRDMRELVYPDIELPEGYGFTYNTLSGRLVIMEEKSIGVPYLDPRYETYHCM